MKMEPEKGPGCVIGLLHVLLLVFVWLLFASMVLKFVD